MIEQAIYELIVRTATDLPDDVMAALANAREKATPGGAECSVLETMLKNADVAKAKRQPVCQDTGTLLFYIKAPVGINTMEFEEAATAAVVRATKEGILRQNCVETLTGHNTGTNVGYGSPVFHWSFSERNDMEITLMLKGGGSENMGIQYSLPDSSLNAGRDLNGVRKCILDAVNRAQGMGCAPGILGVAIGGDRATSYEESKKQLLRHIGERSNEPELAELEASILEEANSLGIGPMGLGGKTTLLDLFIGWRCRLPASYFVSVSYMCWCCRRHTITLPCK